MWRFEVQFPHCMGGLTAAEKSEKPKFKELKMWRKIFPTKTLDFGVTWPTELSGRRRRRAGPELLPSFFSETRFVSKNSNFKSFFAKRFYRSWFKFVIHLPHEHTRQLMYITIHTYILYKVHFKMILQVHLDGYFTRKSPLPALGSKPKTIWLLCSCWGITFGIRGNLHLCSITLKWGCVVFYEISRKSQEIFVNLNRWLKPSYRSTWGAAASFAVRQFWFLCYVNIVEIFRGASPTAPDKPASTSCVI